MDMEQRLMEIERHVHLMDEKYALLQEKNRMYQSLLEDMFDAYIHPLNREPVDIVHEMRNARKILMPATVRDIGRAILQILFQGIEPLPRRCQRPLNFDIAVLWGMGGSPDHFRLMVESMRNGAIRLRVEDGFLSAVLPPAPAWQRHDARFSVSHALVIDAVGLYTNAHHPSTLENLLNSSRELTTAERARAHRAMEFLRRHRISKYNHQPIHPIHIGTHEKKVLVIDQVWGDSSILYGMSSDEAFEDMLCAAKEEHPDADILIKTHPVANNGFRRRHFNESAAGDGVYFIDYDINPISLLEAVDEVYVCTSQLGFEALMCGKRVHTFGMPFYAGWGLTDDRKSCPRRHRQRTLEDVFYMAYIEYSHYVSYETMQPCEIETAMEELLTLRQEYQDHLDHGGGDS